MTELKEFIKECDCDVIQKQLDKKQKNLFHHKYKEMTSIWLPTTQQLIDMLGFHFIHLYRAPEPEQEWTCEYVPRIDIDSHTQIIRNGKSARLALIRAVKRMNV